MKQYWFILVFLSLFYNCDKGSIFQSKDKLSREQMIDVLIQLHTAEVLIASSFSKDSFDLVFKAYERQFFNDKPYTIDHFKHTYTQYKNNPEEMLSLYDSVISRFKQK